MAVTATRITTEITITGQTQEKTTVSVMGFINQIIITSSTPGQSIDLVLVNIFSEEIYREDGLLLDLTLNDIRPSILPLGPVTIKLENPTNASGTVDVTFIEKQRGS